jgi:predicted RNA-binding Zn-ribbon protein involved in translation (DUF1610 family)
MLLGNPQHLASVASRNDLIDEFADYLGASRQQVMSTMMRMCKENPAHVNLNGFVLRPDQVAQTPTRLAVDCINADVRKALPPYHRLVWTVRALEFDPDTGAPLIDRCTSCSRPLAWATMTEVSLCGNCGSDLVRVPQPVAKSQSDVSRFRSALFRSSPADRSRFRAKLPFPIADWPEADLLSLLDTILALEPGDQKLPSRSVIAAIHDGPSEIIKLLSAQLVAFGSHGRISNTVAMARLAIEIRRSPSRRVREFFLALLRTL